MTDRIFVDTNILIYAHDTDAADKHAVAAALLKDLWETGVGCLSTQVLQEFYVNITRKLARPISKAKALDLVESYSVWRVQQIRIDEIRAAIDIEVRNKLSFWDSLIVAAAVSSGCAKLLSEDLNDRQKISGVEIVNPFRKGRPRG
jgi:predicted nucleic acid-binding protein